MEKENPFLLFDFETRTGKKIPYIFQDPLRIYQTSKIEEVAGIFKKVEEAVQNGYYVAGSISYEASPAFDSNLPVHQATDYPLVWFGVFVGPEKYETADFKVSDFEVSEWTYDVSYKDYKEQIAKIKAAIKKGDTDQVNYTSRMEAKFTGDAFSFYQQLARNQEASYTAYLNIGKYRVLSASPELFFRVTGNKITTKPMKGTIKRGRYEKEDAALKKTLSTSKKDQSENLMVVDLLKHELERIAVPGTVKVPKLFELESYPTVYQMTSTIEAEIKTGTTVLNWFEALFPCGSITGAPKKSTMEYIKELETSPRSIYCGALGYITPKKEAVFNVPIRTVLIDAEEKKAIYGVGGGITYESTPLGEYEEMVTKANLLTERRPIFELLESFALKEGEYVLLEEHMERLKKSASYFNFLVDEKRVRQNLFTEAENMSTGLHKVRLTVSRAGEISITSSPIQSIEEPVRCKFSPYPIDHNNPFVYHKTTNREVYEKHQYEAENDSFVLLWNDTGEITEFTTGNIVVQINGNYYTPPVESGLLAGTLRNKLLREGEVRERVIKKEDIQNCEAIYFINSVRGWLSVKI